jgi:hypothetical protein
MAASPPLRPDLDDATTLYQHYRGGSGDTLEVDYQDAYREDEKIGWRSTASWGRSGSGPTAWRAGEWTDLLLHHRRCGTRSRLDRRVSGRDGELAEDSRRPPGLEQRAVTR